MIKEFKIVTKKIIILPMKSVFLGDVSRIDADDSTK
jgi:hypothetical protein